MAPLRLCVFCVLGVNTHQASIAQTTLDGEHGGDVKCVMRARRNLVRAWRAQALRNTVGYCNPGAFAQRNSGAGKNEQYEARKVVLRNDPSCETTRASPRLREPAIMRPDAHTGDRRHRRDSSLPDRWCGRGASAQQDGEPSHRVTMMRRHDGP